VALNRVVGGNPSAIHGSLSANGKLFLVNPSGILFGAGASVNVGGLVASTLEISDSDFLSGNYRFSGSGGSVVNQGNIDAAVVALLGSSVTNEGVIGAQAGSVALATGEQMTLTFADGLTVTVDGEELDALEEEGEAVQGEDGAVAVTESAARSLESRVVAESEPEADGLVPAEDGSFELVADSATAVDPREEPTVSGPPESSAAVVAGGTIEARQILVDAGPGGEARVTGTLDASSPEGEGGSVTVLGERVELEETARLSASGPAGGGAIRVGGGRQGEDPSVRNAEQTLVREGAELAASAGQQGDGGEVIVWADGFTGYRGQISARGGPQGGDGGFAEVSGKEVLDFRGSVDLTAPGGATGELLLDPTNLEIRDTQDGSNLRRNGNTWEPGSAGSTSVLTVSQLQSSLSTANITVSTVGSPDTTGQQGDITLVDDFDGGALANRLKLEAAGAVRFNADLYSQGNLDLWAQAEGEITQAAGAQLGRSGSPLGDVLLEAGAGANQSPAIRVGTIHAGNLQLSSGGGSVVALEGTRLKAEELVLTGGSFVLTQDNEVANLAGDIDGLLNFRNTVDLFAKEVTGSIRGETYQGLWSAGANVTVESTANVSGVNINTRVVRDDPTAGAGDLTVQLVADGADMGLGGSFPDARMAMGGGLANIKTEGGTTTFATTGTNSDLLVGQLVPEEVAQMGDLVFSAARDLKFKDANSGVHDADTPRTITLKAGGSIEVARKLKADTAIFEAATTYTSEGFVEADALSFRDDLAIELPTYAADETPAAVDLSTTDSGNPYVDLRGTLRVEAIDSAVRIRARNASAGSSTVTLAKIDSKNLELDIASGNQLRQAEGSRINTRDLILVGGDGEEGFVLAGDNELNELAGQTASPVFVRNLTNYKGATDAAMNIREVTGGVSGTTYAGLTTGGHNFTVVSNTNFGLGKPLDVGSATVTIRDGLAATSDGIALGLDKRTTLRIGGGLDRIKAAQTVFDTRASGNPIYVNAVNSSGMGSLAFRSGGDLNFIGTEGKPTVAGGALTAEAAGTLVLKEDVTSNGSMSLAGDSIVVGENDTIDLVANGSGSDLTLNGPVRWDSRALVLEAGRDLRIEGAMDGRPASDAATDGSLSFRYGQASSSGVDGSGREARVRIHAPITLPAGPNFSDQLGSGGTLENYRVITQLGDAGSTTGTDLQGMQGDLARNYALGNDIDAAATDSWNGGKGFDPIGGSNNRLQGNFHGLGHRIAGLTIVRPDEDDVGLGGGGAGTRQCGWFGGACVRRGA
jgi:hypothetical protein